MDDLVTRSDQAQLHPLALRFRDRDLEAGFRAARAGGNLRQLRISMLVAAALNAGFAPLDYLVLTENLFTALIIRVPVATAVFLGLLGLTYSPLFRGREACLPPIAVFCFTLEYAALNAIAASPDVYLSGYIIATLYLLIFVPMGFVASSGLAWFCTVIFAVIIPLSRTIALGSLLTVYAQFIAANLVGMFVLYWMERFRRLDFLNLRRIADERSRHHALLARILPRGVIERLERGEQRIADEFPESTVLFADIVGFTELSSRHKPAEIVEFLNVVFGRFDELVERHAVEKIKTIGDAYMVAGGVPDRRPGHVEAIANLALDMIAETTRMLGPDGKPLQIRIGIHSGPLIAGVIGESRFGYDLWGNTVNTASRMESHGAPSCIQVSDSVYRRLKDKFALEPQGEIEIKGKGAMITWHLIGRLRVPAPTSA
jgi:class 3 adenylate cyclase